MCDARLFAPQIERFSRSRQIVLGTMYDDQSIDHMATRVLQNSPPKFDLLGLSMGGIVAMKIAELAPDRLTGLALLDTNPLSEPTEKQLNRDKQIELVKQGGLRAVIRDEMKPNYLADTSNKDQILDLCMAMAEDLGTVIFESQSLALRNRPDQLQTLKQIKVPTLVLCGEFDQLCPPERHQLIHRHIIGSELRIIPNAGHLPTLEQAKLTNEAIQQWLQH